MRYRFDAERVQEEIWKDIEVRDKVVIDVGIGESTKKLIELGARVICVEKNLQKVEEHSSIKVPIMLCDFLNFPFRNRVADLVIFHFTIHEINPGLHMKTLRLAGEVAPQLLIVEPAPRGSPVYEEFSRLWRDAMHSIGGFEDYMPMEYWENVMKQAGFEVIRRKSVKWRVELSRDLLREIIEKTAREWLGMGVSSRFIEELRKFPTRHSKMKWSDINVILGKAP